MINKIIVGMMFPMIFQDSNTRSVVVHPALSSSCIYTQNVLVAILANLVKKFCEIERGSKRNDLDRKK